MATAASGRLSDLVLVRMHGRPAEYLWATDSDRRRIAEECRRASTVSDLPERILARTIYAQASSRVGPLRELLQNALDASPRGARIDVRSSRGDNVLAVTDHGCGMTCAALMEDLLVPFRSAKDLAPDTIGEHGIGFLSALEIAPWIEVYSCAVGGAHRLSIAPIGSGPPYADFAYTLAEVPAVPGAGTVVRLSLEQPIARAALVEEVTAAAGMVDPAMARIYVNDVLVNLARSRMRRVARVPVGEGACFGKLDLFAGRGDGIVPRFAVTQKGLLVSAAAEVFAAPELALHRDLLRAITNSGYGVVADLSLDVPLIKGRSAVAGFAARATASAIIAAFERFVLEDALYDRELLRGVDHRLSSLLDRLVTAELAGEIPPPSEFGYARPSGVDTVPASTHVVERPRVPTVAAPEAVVRFACALLDAPLFVVSSFEPGAGKAERNCTLRTVIQAHRAGLLRAMGNERGPYRSGALYLAASDPLTQALLRRLSVHPSPVQAEAAAPPRPCPMPRVHRQRLLAASDVPGIGALIAALEILERVDAAISAGSGIAVSTVSVHQDLYGPDEMAHTDGSGISLNVASPRVRALITAVLVADDPAAFGALVDLLLHEKAHVALASYVPRANAEHGASFYRQKDHLRRRLLDAIAVNTIDDPFHCLRAARSALASTELPSTAELAASFGFTPIAA